MTHVVTENDLTDYIEGIRQGWHQYASSAGGPDVKKLEFCMGHVAPLYKVSFQGRDVYIGALKETAVREYNALP